MSSSPPVVEKSVVNNTTPVIPRKRRRRAPAAGAAEDCFTCRKRQTKCDRRRPYCTPCIQLGKECSGYRTTLTWGVGVASRGKLRGLSLPVAKSAPASAPRSVKKSNSKSPPPNTSQPSSGGAASQPRQTDPSSTQTTPRPQKPPFDFDGTQATSPISIPTSAPPGVGWHIANYAEQHEGYHMFSSRAPRMDPRSGPLQRLQTSIATHYDEAGLSASTGSVSAYSDGDFPSPGDYPQTPEDFPFVEPPFSFPDTYLPQTPRSSTESLGFRDVPRSLPVASDDVSSSISSEDQHNYDFIDANNPLHSVFGPGSMSDSFYDLDAAAGAIYQPETSDTHNFGKGFENAHSHHHHGSIASTQSSTSTDTPGMGAQVRRGMNQNPMGHLPPSMQFLLDYYDKQICPVLVAFDGPTNPYRIHVTHLAIGSEALQNAIAALSLNNIRMKRCTNYHRNKYMSDEAARTLTLREIKDAHGEPSPEELRYKARSVQLLNAQLADSRLAKDDSVLATLLILCLFHVCNSGFSKFKTQLAGVQKLLSLRDSSEQSHFVNWIEMFFTWFDVMTSAVNDREPQMRPDGLDMLEMTSNPGALEHLAGCDARLFKLIARLGRLNLLAQNKPVSPLPDRTHTPTPQHKSSRDYYSLPPTYDHLDGNGWGSPIPQRLPSPSPSSATSTAHSQFPLPSPPLGPTSGLTSNHQFSDPRHDFWTEWHSIRDYLHTWSLGAPPAPFISGSPHNLSAQDADVLSLHHTSHLFHTSALLYTTRLASPSLPSSAPPLQSLVQRALHHVHAIPPSSAGNKFLLWPLFVVGTECVEEAHRQIIRWRCWEICRESGFGNNLSGLEVLERVWRAEGVEREDIGCAMGSTGGFWWKGAMRGREGDGEYVIV